MSLSTNSRVTMPAHLMIIYQDKTNKKNKADPLMLPERTHLAFMAVWISSASLWIPTHSSWKQLAGRVCLLWFSIQNMSNCMFTRGERKKDSKATSILCFMLVCTQAYG